MHPRRTRSAPPSQSKTFFGKKKCTPADKILATPMVNIVPRIVFVVTKLRKSEEEEKRTLIVIRDGDELVRIDDVVELNKFAAVCDRVRGVTEDVCQRVDVRRVPRVLVAQPRHVVFEVQTKTISRNHPQTSPIVFALEMRHQVKLGTHDA